MVPGLTGSLVGQQLGDYHLLSLLGAGGMAEVYRGLDIGLHREVAVKVLPASLAMDSGYVSRFRAEARRVAALDHPNIVPVYHYGEERGLLYLVMPLLRESLRDRMDREEIPIVTAARYVMEIAAGLDVAHVQGIVHRDVKPENILINDEGAALLTDFGIAREAAILRQPGQARTLAATGLPVGTPEYMAPEQLRASNVDQRADVYALGIVLYELLTGIVPHDAPTPYEVAALALTQPIAPPSTHNARIWPELDQVVLKAVAADPQRRYQDMRSLALALRQAILNHSARLQRVTTAAPGLATGGLAQSGVHTASFSRSGVHLVGRDQSGIHALPRLSSPPAFVPAPDPISAAPTAQPRSSISWRSDVPRTTSHRHWSLMGTLVVLLIIGLVLGGGIALISGFGVLPGSIGGHGGVSAAGDAAGPGSGLGHTSATPSAAQTPGARATPDTTTTGGNSDGLTGNPSAGGNPATGGQTNPTPTTAPSGSPPAPTATPVPAVPFVEFNPGNWLLTQSGNTCSGTQTIRNLTTHIVSWSWEAIPTGSLRWAVNPPSLPPAQLNSKNPTQASLGPGATDTLYIIMSCDGTSTPIAVLVTDLNTGASTTQPFTLTSP